MERDGPSLRDSPLHSVAGSLACKSHGPRRFPFARHCVGLYTRTWTRARRAAPRRAGAAGGKMGQGLFLSSSVTRSGFKPAYTRAKRERAKERRDSDFVHARRHDTMPWSLLLFWNRRVHARDSPPCQVATIMGGQSARRQSACNNNRKKEEKQDAANTKWSLKYRSILLTILTIYLLTRT